MKGLVAFSFASRSENEEPNPCCVRLAAAAKRIVSHEPQRVVVVAQWEVARALKSSDVNVARAVELLPDGSYLDSEAVWAEARELFISLGIKEVVPVAQPFLQMAKVVRLIERDGFTIDRRKIGYIGFDPRSSQWWTRDPLRLAMYAVAQTLLGIRGHHGRQAAAR